MTCERKRQLQLHLIHPPKTPAYFCNSLRPGLLSRLTHICHAKQSLKTTLFSTISFLLHSVSQCSWTVKWDHHHGRSDVCLFWLKGQQGVAFGSYQLRIMKQLSLEWLTSSLCSLLMLSGCQGSQVSSGPYVRRSPRKVMDPTKGRITIWAEPSLHRHFRKWQWQALQHDWGLFFFFTPGIHLLALPVVALR